MRFLFLALLVACGKPPASEGVRIVSLLPSFTELLVELDATEHLVACTAYGRPGREMRRVPWQGASAAEAILREHPSLVLRQTPRRGADALRAALEEAGVEVVSLPSETVADVRAAILRIGEVVGRKEAARRYLERFDRSLAAATAGVSGAKARPRVLFVIGRDPGAVANVRAAGPGSFLDELIRLAGGENALDGAYPAYADLRLERVARLRPDVIIDNLPPESEHLAAWRSLSWIPAVRSGRVYAIRDNELLIPGPHLPRAVERLAEILHGRS